MNYTKLFFGKEIEELQYSDIEKFFIVEKDESDKIEFKSYFSPEENHHTDKENGVIRAICALLNSEGGIVIWGSPIGVKVEGKKEKVFKGVLSPCEKLIEKDSFISKITDLITPSPRGIKFQRLEKEGKFVYIIDVEKSFYSPHQFRNIYYMRIDGQTKPAPHHFIEALVKKVSFPKLEGYLKFNYASIDNDNYSLQVSPYIFNMSKLQNEHEIYYRLIVTTGTFYNSGNVSDPNRTYSLQGHEVRVVNAKSTLYYNEPYTTTEFISIKISDLESSNYECEFHFIFGGKQSPLMTSIYKLKLWNVTLNNLNSHLIQIEENKYIFERTEGVEISDVDKIKLLLGR